ncbi:hypothetical protein BAE44_0014250 [Dichanthelium oligosanthes]|uniref:Uncharacterized protein n=1 Tax=Dichanthelium oligosanthes TaxID=888268 RepID=A0A1E5VHX4_9POAL|nr:hypothetical protein BAE44_0014250 [Dichanthelium oligosanthes]
MKKGSTVLAISLLTLLAFASQSSWCAAEGSAGVSAGWHRFRPHLQVQEELHGKKDLEIQSASRKLGLGHGVSTVEMKHHRRMITGHKGGGVGGGGGAGGAGAGAGAGGRNVGGGGAVTRPHNSKNGAAALPVPVASVLALAFGCGVALSAFSF